MHTIKPNIEAQRGEKKRARVKILSPGERTVSRRPDHREIAQVKEKVSQKKRWGGTHGSSAPKQGKIL